MFSKAHGGVAMNINPSILVPVDTFLLRFFVGVVTPPLSSTRFRSRTLCLHAAKVRPDRHRAIEGTSSTRFVVL